MDFHLKQFRNQHESKFLPEPYHKPQSSASTLPLFVAEPNSKVSSTLSVLSDLTLATSRFPRMGSYFSFAQWQELELQALIFRYMLAGDAVPPELLQPIKKSLLHSNPYFLNHSIQHDHPSWYWGRAAMDPEPGRCRRTDGKKWRCSRDVMAGQKYCERHMHRGGRNRSRKPVELPIPTSATGGDGGYLGSASTTSISSPSLGTASFNSPFDLLHLNERSSVTKNDSKSLFETQDHMDGDGRSHDGHVLRHFFDDSDHGESNAGQATFLSISIPGNTTSDVSLKLSTGFGEDPCPRNGNVLDLKQMQLKWGRGWTSTRSQVASIGGPLAEALRSSTSTSSPTSVLLQLPSSSASETSFIT